MSPAEDLEEQQAGGHRRHDQRQGEGRFHDRLPAPLESGQQPGNQKAGGNDEGGAQRGDAKGEADDPPVVTGHRTVVLTRKPYLRKISCAAGDWR